MTRKMACQVNMLLSAYIKEHSWLPCKEAVLQKVLGCGGNNAPAQGGKYAMQLMTLLPIENIRISEPKIGAQTMSLIFH